MTDHPAGEPRTEAGRALRDFIAALIGKNADEVDPRHILAIEREAAAPPEPLRPDSIDQFVEDVLDFQRMREAGFLDSYLNIEGVSGEAEAEALLSADMAAYAALARSAAPSEPPRSDPDERWLRLSDVSAILDLAAWYDDAKERGDLSVEQVDGAKWLASWLGHKIAALDWYPSAAPPEPPRPDLLRQVGEALVAVHTASDGQDMPLVELMDADLFGLVTEAVAAYSSRSAAPEGQPLDVERLADDVRHGGPVSDYWRGFNAGVDALVARLAESSEHPEASE